MPTVTVITGASGGIGAALARRLGHAGHRLVLGARRADALQEVAESITSTAIAVPTDVTVRAEVDALGRAALERFGRVDVWVNNAGRGLTAPVLALTDAQLDDMVTVNVKSALYGMQTIVPHFVERGEGHLINVSSFLARAPIASVRSAYSAAKAMLNSLTANLRMDLAQSHPDVHVTTIMPGLVSTEFAHNAGHEGPLAAASVAMGIQTPDEVADIIADVIARPRAEVYTNPNSVAVVRRYLEETGALG
ncbi:MAG TPA: SDR family oxidoreductase [Gemmatimonadaceae bacterium]|nr:SDR family oxidoreductase [Gemmatimonadaceae bacterium]